MAVDQSSTSRAIRAFARFDQANGEDPHRERVGNIDRPRALIYAERMSTCLDRLAPEAPEAVRLAARCQHIRRWTIPRQRYPEGRDGYRRWRTNLARFHADTAGAILREVGYDEPTIERVKSLLRKERLKADPDVQLLEDVICLVFLEHYLGDFSRRHERDKLLDIIRKTLRKMSRTGRERALALELDQPVRELVQEALEAV